RSIDSDVSNVGALIRMAGLLPSGFDMAPYLEEARRQLHEETDYLLEGRQLARFGALLASDARFLVPLLHEDWTRGSVLAMGYVRGEPIEAAEAAADVCDRIAHDLIDLTLRELFDFGLMQTDPNFANYQYDRDSGRIILLDFGATREIDPHIAQLYRALLGAGLADDRAEMARLAIEIGFFDTECPTRHRERICGMMAMVFSALRATPVFDFAKTDLPERMQEEGMALAEEGFLPPEVPMDVLYLQRKFGGMFQLAKRLRARVPVLALLKKRLG
ncbi:MAG: AarF/UbiB family protein, partial [Pseudomonadota bacterium]